MAKPKKKPKAAKVVENEETLPDTPRSKVTRPDPKRRRDLRPFIYGGLDLLFAAVYLFSVTELSPNRHGWAQALLLCLPVGAVAMAAGTLTGALVKNPSVARIAWIGAVAGGALMLVVTVVLLALLLASAAFLSGVYGAIGKGAASGVLAAAALIVEVAGILPAFQLKYLMTRGGRRAFGLTPLW
jgi:hypothetical protein